MAAMRVVPAFDEIEHRRAGLDLGFETLAVEQLALEGREKTLAHGVIEAITHRAHRRLHAGLLATFAKSERGVLSGFKRSSQRIV
jgi:hypothetical protein